jgi:DnaJ-class molecular chaperone
MAQDYYSLLGVSKSASLQEIKSAYRKLALEWHPDRNKTAGAAEKFKEINQAYEVLADPQKKEMYDQYGHDAFTRQGSRGGAPGGNQGPFSYTYTGGENPFGDFGTSDPFEIFEQFFGFGAQGGRRQRRQAYQISISFDEAAHGVEKEVNMDGKKKKLKIPAGVDDNMRIRFSDFDLIVRVSSSSQFRRQGQDIYVEVALGLTQAILGGVITVPTLDDVVKVKVKPGTQHGTMLRLKGKGIVYPNTKQHGDEYIVFSVKIPEKINNKQKKLLEEFEKESR